MAVDIVRDRRIPVSVLTGQTEVASQAAVEPHEVDEDPRLADFRLVLARTLVGSHTSGRLSNAEADPIESLLKPDVSRDRLIRDGNQIIRVHGNNSEAAVRELAGHLHNLLDFSSVTFPRHESTRPPLFVSRVSAAKPQ